MNYITFTGANTAQFPLKQNSTSRAAFCVLIALYINPFTYNKIINTPAMLCINANVTAVENAESAWIFLERKLMFLYGNQHPWFYNNQNNTDISNLYGKTINLWNIAGIYVSVWVYSIEHFRNPWNFGTK